MSLFQRLLKYFKSEDDPDGYWVTDPDGASEVYLQAGYFDEWYPISETHEVLVRSSDMIGRFWIRERQ